jgi:hypothetical protein
VQGYQRAVLGFLHGKYLSFRRGSFRLSVTPFNPPRRYKRGLRNPGATARELLALLLFAVPLVLTLQKLLLLLALTERNHQFAVEQETRPRPSAHLQRYTQNELFLSALAVLIAL